MVPFILHDGCSYFSACSAGLTNVETTRYHLLPEIVRGTPQAVSGLFSFAGDRAATVRSQGKDHRGAHEFDRRDICGLAWGFNMGRCWNWQLIGGVPLMGLPKNGGFLLGKIPLKWMIWEYPHLWKPPIGVLLVGWQLVATFTVFYWTLRMDGHVQSYCVGICGIITLAGSETHRAMRVKEGQCLAPPKAHRIPAPERLCQALAHLGLSYRSRSHGCSDWKSSSKCPKRAWGMEIARRQVRGSHWASMVEVVGSLLKNVCHVIGAVGISSLHPFGFLDETPDISPQLIYK